MLPEDMSDILITSDDIQKRVAELGSQISADYSGQDLLLIAVLKGAVLFLTDLFHGHLLIRR